MARNNRLFGDCFLSGAQTARLISCLRSARPLRQILRSLAVLATLTGLSLLLNPIPVSASLRLVGNAPHASLWQHIYEQLPSVWKSDRAVMVRELSDTEMAEFVAQNVGGGGDRHAHDDWVIDGCYEASSDPHGDAGTIRVCARLQGQAAELIFTHEYGHFIWLEKLSKQQRGVYQRLWRQQKRVHHLVTEYAAESVAEGFAESLAYFLRQPATLRRSDPVSYRFCCDLLGVTKAPGEA